MRNNPITQFISGPQGSPTGHMQIGDDEARGGRSSQSGTEDELSLRAHDPLPEGSSDIDGKLQLQQVMQGLFQVTPENPVKVGRWLIHQQLGTGGMGTVYLAYDPTLERKVAIKLLKSGRDLERQKGRQRLLREARAMAQIDHQNVVKVHDAMALDGQTYVVMEYFPEGSLRQWQAQLHGLPKVLDVYMQAGRGLVQLHAAGLVHRDFKPDNIFMKGNDRVAVGDLGLVQMMAEPPASDGTSEEEEPYGGEAAITGTSWPDGERLTEAGAILGTVQYMAPEQLRGEPADARSDQFSFCVALYEAACGRRPFAGERRQDLLEAIESNRIAEPARRVPSWLMRALRRGLAKRPDGRFASMQALLNELDRGRRRRMYKWVMAGAVIALGATLVPALMHTSRVDTCTRSWFQRELDQIWGDAHKQELRVRFARAGAEEALAALFHRTDMTEDSWLSGQVLQCAGQLSRTERRQVDRCLDDSRRQLVSIRSGLLAAPQLHLAGMDLALQNLERLDYCGDVDALSQKQLPKDNPLLQRQIDAIDEQLATASELEYQGMYAEAEAYARTAVTSALQLDDLPARARAYYQLGRILSQLGKIQEALTMLEAAADIAARARELELAADALIYMAKTAVEDSGEAARTRELIRAARVALLFEGVIPFSWGESDTVPYSIRTAEYFEARGLLASFEEEHQEAAREHERALEIRIGLLGLGLPTLRLSNSYNNLGNALAELGREEEALANFCHALKMRESLLGTHHPLVAEVLFNIGYTYEAMEDWGKARPVLERAAHIDLQTYGDKSAKRLPGLLVLGSVELAAGELARAKEIRGEILAIWETLSPQERSHADQAQVPTFQAMIAAQEQSWEEAFLDLMRAADILAGTPAYATTFRNTWLEALKIHAQFGTLRETCQIANRGLRAMGDAADQEYRDQVKDLCKP